MKTRGGVYAVVRDAALLAAGIFGILYQQVTGKTNLELLLVYLVITQVPGAIGLLNLYARGKRETIGTVEQPSPSPSEPL